MKKFLFFLFLPLSGFATHNISGEITYRHISGYTYEITVTTYTKASSPADRCELTVHFGDGDSAVFPRVNGSTFMCDPPAGDGLQIANGIKWNIYKGTHVYPGNGNYYITMFDPNRQAGIVNIPNSVNIPFAFKAYLVINPFIVSNSSPTFNTVPIDSAWIYQYYAYHQSVTETDGDSLVYTLTPCYGNGVQFIPGYTFPTNSYINSQNGILAWNTPQPAVCPPWCSYPQIYDFAMQIAEYRYVGNSWIQIGYCMQDIYIEVHDVLSVPENNSSINISTFPNPSNTEINFNVNGLTERESRLVITDITGKEIKILRVENGNNAIDLRDLSPGLYFYNLNTQKGKFIVSQ